MYRLYTVGLECDLKHFYYVYNLLDIKTAFHELLKSHKVAAMYITATDGVIFNRELMTYLQECISYQSQATSCTGRKAILAIYFKERIKNLLSCPVILPLLPARL